MLLAEEQRRSRAPRPIQRQIDQHVRWLRAQLGAVEKDLAQTLRESPVWREKDNLLRSVPGLGPVLTTTLLGDVLELGRLNRKQIAALIGAPRPNTASGAHARHRAPSGGGGHART